MGQTGSVSRYRGGEVRLVAYPTHNDDTNPINVNDLCGYDGTYIWPASHYSSITTFAQQFAGVAVSKVGLQSGEKSFRLTTDLGYVLIAESGEFAMDCATGKSWKPNSLVAGVLTSGAVENQGVAIAADTGTAIGICKLLPKELGVTTLTEVIVQIQPAVRYAQVDSGL